MNFVAFLQASTMLFYKFALQGSLFTTKSSPGA